jgi:hypothetical protein
MPPSYRSRKRWRSITIDGRRISARDVSRAREKTISLMAVSSSNGRHTPISRRRSHGRLFLQAEALASSPHRPMILLNHQVA